MTKKPRKSKNDGKDHEAKVSQMVRKLYPYAVVRDDVKLPALITGGKRQIDTLLDTGTQIIDFDAKDHTRNIGIDEVASYGFKLKDEDIQLGVMVSNSPYAQSAVAAATHFGIRPTHLIDTTDDDNPFSIASNTLIELRYIRFLRFGIENKSAGSSFSVFQDLGEQELVPDSGGSTVKAYDVFRDMLWNSGSLMEMLTEFNNGNDGTYSYTLPNQEIVMTDESRGFVDKFIFDYEVCTKYLEGVWNIKHARGLYDAAKNTFETNQKVVSEILTTEEISNWPTVASAQLDKAKYGIIIEGIAELPETGDA